jgi:hypothetical protein
VSASGPRRHPSTRRSLSDSHRAGTLGAPRWHDLPLRQRRHRERSVPSQDGRRWPRHPNRRRSRPHPAVPQRRAGERVHHLHRARSPRRGHSAIRLHQVRADQPGGDRHRHLAASNPPELRSEPHERRGSPLRASRRRKLTGTRSERDSENDHRSSRRSGWSWGTSTRTIRTPSGSSIHISTSPRAPAAGHAPPALPRPAASDAPLRRRALESIAPSRSRVPGSTGHLPRGSRRRERTRRQGHPDGQTLDRPPAPTCPGRIVGFAPAPTDAAECGYPVPPHASSCPAARHPKGTLPIHRRGRSGKRPARLRQGGCGTARPGRAHDPRAGRGARQLPDPYEI